VRKDLLLILLSLVLVLLAAEGLLRTFPALLPLELQIALEDRPETRGVSHPYIGNLHTPNGTHVVRTPEFEIPYPTDPHLGDALLGDALRSSYLYHWARFVREVYRDWRAGEPKDLQLADGSHVKLRPDDLAKKTAYIEPGNPIFDLSLDALKRINAVATSHGTHVIVVLQPGKEETYLPLLDGTPADPGAPLRAALEARGIEYLDLLPLFREQAAAGAKLFYEFDGHPNAQGYRLTAEKILAYLADNAERYGLEPPDWAMNWGTSVETTPAVASHRANRKSCAETRRTPTRRE
jgi:hypothetical protein